MFQTVKKSLCFHLVAVNDFVMYILGMWVITMRMLMYGAINCDGTGCVLSYFNCKALCLSFYLLYCIFEMILYTFVFILTS